MLKNARNLANKYGPKLSLIAAPVVIFANSALAEVPTEASTALTTLGTDSGTMQGLIWTAMIPIAIGWKLMSMFKKGASKI